MKRTEMNRTETDRDEIDRILATEEELIPSSGFVASVMESVRDEAAAPPPIPFPWVRAVPGMILTAGVLGWGAVELIRTGLPALREVSLTPPQLSATVMRPLEEVGWIALALGLSLLSWLLSRRLAGRTGLL